MGDLAVGLASLQQTLQEAADTGRLVLAGRNLHSMPPLASHADSFDPSEIAELGRPRHRQTC
jgi:hypothetical protein